MVRSSYCLQNITGAVTKSRTGTWDSDSGTWDSGTWDAGTRGRDKQTTPEFVKYNFRWSRGRCNMLESLSGDSTSKAFVEGKSTR